MTRDRWCGRDRADAVNAGRTPAGSIPIPTTIPSRPDATARNGPLSVPGIARHWRSDRLALAMRLRRGGIVDSAR